MYVSSRILYVDDDRDSCDLMGLLLQREYEDCEVVAAESAEEAVELMQDLSFDLFILDWRLPKTSGVELCRMIRKADEGVPIMFYSAMARPADRTVARSAGANAYLVKPNDLEVLADTVRWLLEENRQSPQGSPRFRSSPRIRNGKSIL